MLAELSHAFQHAALLHSLIPVHAHYHMFPTHTCAHWVSSMEVTTQVRDPSKELYIP